MSRNKASSVRSSARLSSLLLLCVPLFSAAPAWSQDAPTKDQCFDSHERGQVLEKEGKILRARKDFRTCAHAKCPKMVKAECEKMLAALEKSVPSVKISARNADGGEPEGLQIAVDGQALPAPAADGSIELDPGEHVVQFATSDGRTLEKKFTLELGQRGVEVTGEIPPKEGPMETPLAPEEPEKPKIRPVVYVLGGVAVIGLGGFVGFGLSGKSKQGDLDSCKPSCNQGDYDSMKSSYLLADISLGVALAAGGVAAYIYLSDKKKHTGQENVSWVRSTPTRGGAQVQLGTTF